MNAGVAVFQSWGNGFQRWSLGRAREYQADIVVTGHTHLDTRAEHGHRLFLNSCTCSEGRFSFLALDMGGGQYALGAGHYPLPSRARVI